MIRDYVNYQSLPPLKRFTLRHHHLDDDDDKENVDPSPPSSFPLPAKKRRESRPPFLPSSHPLPTKKRVWAPPPAGIIDLSVPDPIDEQPNLELNKEPDHTPAAESLEETPEDDDDGVRCAICQSSDGDPADPIVFCNGCDLMAHATCYGNPLAHGIPEGDWFCHRCRASPSDGTTVACCLCPNAGGAMKPTVDGQWAHVVCAVFVPEVFFEDAEGREGINCGGVQEGTRGRSCCCVCGKRSGGLVGCSERRCNRGFHVTCGLGEDLWLDYREGRGKAVVAGFCSDHTELWKKVS